MGLDWKRIGLGAATMGATEGWGARTAYDAFSTDGPMKMPGVGDIPVVGPAYDALAAGAKDLVTAEKAVAYQPTQNTSPYGDPTHNATADARNTAVAAGYRQGAAEAQGRGINTGAADAARGQQGQDAQWFRDFAAQGPGPSVAEAQLQAAQDQNMRQALALAGSGRGNLGANAALRGAAQQRADAATQTGGQMALLRAQEEDMWRQRQVDAGKAAADVTTSMRTGDLETLNTLIQNRQVNDALSVALGEQGLTAEQIAQRYGEMDAQQRLEFERMMGEFFMQAQTVNVESDAQRDAATIAALGGVAEAGLGFAGQAARAAGDAVPL